MKDNKLNEKKFYKQWWFWVIIAVVALAGIGMSGAKKQDQDNSKNQSQQEIKPEESKPQQQEAEKAEQDNTTTYSFMDKIHSNDWKIEIGAGAMVTSDDNGNQFVQLPVTLSNNHYNQSRIFGEDEYEYYGSKGTLQEHSAGEYYSSSDIKFFGEIPYGESKHGSFHIPYDGDGTYKINIKNPTNGKVSVVQFEVKSKK